MTYHIEHDTVEETLIIPLFARKVCSKHYPELCYDPDAERICDSLDYDFARKEPLMESRMGLFGALEAAQRHYDLQCEIKAYLKEHPGAAVVNLGCGLDDTFSKVDNGMCHGYNIDLPSVTAIRNELLPPREREENIACDLNDFSWMDRIDASDGAVFFAAGVFYYFKTEDLRKLIAELAERFPGGVIAFDACNKTGAKMMRKTWLKEAGITNVEAYFSLNDKNELYAWSERIEDVQGRSYMRGYRDIYPHVGLLYKLMIRFCDSAVRMEIIHIRFRR